MCQMPQMPRMPKIERVSNNPFTSTSGSWYTFDFERRAMRGWIRVSGASELLTGQCLGYLRFVVWLFRTSTRRGLHASHY